MANCTAECVVLFGAVVKAVTGVGPVVGVLKNLTKAFNVLRWRRGRSAPERTSACVNKDVGDRCIP